VCLILLGVLGFGLFVLLVVLFAFCGCFAGLGGFLGGFECFVGGVVLCWGGLLGVGWIVFGWGVCVLGFFCEVVVSLVFLGFGGCCLWGGWEICWVLWALGLW